MPTLTILIVAGSWLLLLVLTIWKTARWKDEGDE
jgi:hypothetical protein